MNTKPGDLQGRVALVTGSSRGIGRAIALALGGAGADVAVNCRTHAGGAEEVVTALRAMGRRAIAVAADVSVREAVEEMVVRIGRELGPVEILVNNAGIAIRKAPQDYAEAEWRSVLDTNLTSAFFCAQACHPAMKQSGGGKIINIGSMMSLFGAPYAVPYAASKGGLVQMTKALATAWAEDNIQVNAILPGWIDTALTATARAQVPGLSDQVVARTPAGRWGEPDDLAGAAVFLASAASAFVTGTALPVDGGYSARA